MAVRFNSDSLQGTQIELVEKDTNIVLEVFPSISKAKKFFVMSKERGIYKLMSPKNAIEVLYKNQKKIVYLKEKV